MRSSPEACFRSKFATHQDAARTAPLAKAFSCRGETRLPSAYAWLPSSRLIRAQDDHVKVAEKTSLSVGSRRLAVLISVSRNRRPGLGARPDDYALHLRGALEDGEVVGRGPIRAACMLTIMGLAWKEAPDHRWSSSASFPLLTEHKRNGAPSRRSSAAWRLKDAMVQAVA
jgi:hypothetical protein